jgi:hypothetical protein
MLRPLATNSRAGRPTKQIAIKPSDGGMARVRFCCLLAPEMYITIQLGQITRLQPSHGAIGTQSGQSRQEVDMKKITGASVLAAFERKSELVMGIPHCMCRLYPTGRSLAMGIRNSG